MNPDKDVHTGGWMDDALSYLKGACAASWWTDLLIHWRRFEQRMSTLECQGSRRFLSTKGRPEEVKFWISHGRNYTKPPKIANLSLFISALTHWWWRLQPECRRVDDGYWPLSRDIPVGTRWGELQLGGQNGLFMVIMSLLWW
ncbi:uncharacterized protein BXZ73DRAFT_60019, partial [Epithele typhae]|uniref:uncharacterized protein n=1 Tax=Epithele typhae TaxID=378194 RepID=UPI002007E812